jgi:hypothetical protein
MQAIQNIQQHQASRALTMSANSLWSDTVCGFTYNNEPKQTKTGI